jgi:hypothetical protein
LLDDRRFAIAREMRVQMIIVWIHDASVMKVGRGNDAGRPPICQG